MCPYRLMEPEATFQVLDKYEGSEFERVIVSDAWFTVRVPG